MLVANMHENPESAIARKIPLCSVLTKTIAISKIFARLNRFSASTNLLAILTAAVIFNVRRFYGAVVWLTIVVDKCVVACECQLRANADAAV